MRYFLVTSLLALAALASPVNIQKRAAVTSTVYETVTDIVWVLPGGTPVSSNAPVEFYRVSATSTDASTTPPPSAAPAAATTSSPPPPPPPTTTPPPPPPSTTPPPPPPPTTSAQPVAQAAASAVANAVGNVVGSVLGGGNYGGNDYQSKILSSHNAYRSKHSAPPLSWDAGLAAAASQLAAGCVMSHDTSIGGGGYGQNLAMGVPADSVTSAVDMWYNEISAFSGWGLPNPGGDFGSYGHFTQVVWKSSTSIGCATSGCGLTVCNYSAAGNMGGQYGNNVSPS